jgi:hypothetical protein
VSITAVSEECEQQQPAIQGCSSHADRVRLCQNSNQVEEGEAARIQIKASRGCEHFPLETGYINIKIICLQFLGNCEQAKSQSASSTIATMNQISLMIDSLAKLFLLAS